MEPTAHLFAGIVATFFAAGFVKGVTGMGLPTVAMGVLGAFLSPLAAAGLLLAPSLVTNLWQLFTGARLQPLIRRLWPMMLAIMIGTVASSRFLAGGDTTASTTVLGIALAVYAAYTLFARATTISRRQERAASPIVGAVTGMITGGTGVFVIPAVPYLASLALGKDELIQALGLSFTISTIALGVGLAWNDALPAENSLASVLCIAPALAGMFVGQAVRARISPALFRRVFLVLLLLLGLEMALRPLV